LSVCLSVCLLVSNKRQNGWTDRAQIFCGTSRDPREGLWIIEILKICVLEVFNFVRKLNFWKSANFFFKNPQNFFIFVLKCKQKEHVHNLNRRWARSARKAYKEGREATWISSFYIFGKYDYNVSRLQDSLGFVENSRPGVRLSNPWLR